MGCDYVVKALEEAMNTISSVSQATGESAPNVTIGGTGEIIALDELDVSDLSWVWGRSM